MLKLLRTCLALSALSLTVPACAGAAQLPEEEIVTAMDAVIAEGAPGVIVHVETGETGRSFARGLADPRTGLEMDPAFLVRMASVTKLYTAALIVRLSQDGLIELDGRIADYLPAETLDDIANAGEITVRQLLNHTSGIPDYYDDHTEATWDWTRPLTEDRVLDYVRGKPATGSAGEQHEYSNSNYHLLSLIAQRVAEAPLDTLYDRYLLDPLGLDRTLYNGLFAPQDRIRGIGTDTDPEQDTYSWQENSGPDGGLVAPAGEIALFLRALFSPDGELAETGAIMLADPVHTEENNTYGLGVDILETGAGPILGHAGSVWGYRTGAYYIAERDTAFVVHVNHNDGPYLGQVFRGVGRALIAASSGE
jgi:D-alanyl-D-alanine carboxypeptidase